MYTAFSARQAALPYGIDIDEDGRTVRVFNREYGTISRFTMGRRLAPTQVTGMAAPDSYYNSDGTHRHDDGSVSRIYFYHDGCIPFSSTKAPHAAHTDAYLKRISVFGRIGVVEKPRWLPYQSEGVPA